MRLFRPWFLSYLLYPEALFRIKTGDKLLCLTFDDGPDPNSTLFLLNTLKEHSVKAIFFCNGDSAIKYPALIERIKEDGHIIGNHGYLHLDGWKTSLSEYIDNAAKADSFTSTDLFRPPYGRLRIRQYLKLKTRYKVMFWDILPYDFDKTFGGRNSYEILICKLRPGSIIVLHDKADSTAPEFLGGFLQYALNQGYKFIIPTALI